MREKILILGILLFIVGCNVFAVTNVTAKLEDSNIKSGASTTIIVEAENLKETKISGYFDIVPDCDQVTVEKDDRVFEVGAKETTGKRRHKISAYTNSKEQKFEIQVFFKDATTHKVIGKDKVVLKVRK